MSKRLQLQGEIGGISINYLTKRRMRGDLIETFKIISGISNHGRHFLIFLLKLKIYYQGRFQKEFLLIYF